MNEDVSGFIRAAKTLGATIDTQLDYYSYDVVVKTSTSRVRIAQSHDSGRIYWTESDGKGNARGSGIFTDYADKDGLLYAYAAAMGYYSTERGWQ